MSMKPANGTTVQDSLVKIIHLLDITTPVPETKHTSSEYVRPRTESPPNGGPNRVVIA